MENAAQKPLISMTRSPHTAPPARAKARDADFEADFGFEAYFEALFHQYWEPLCRILYQILGDWDEAEDLALETFYQLHLRPPADDRNLVGWLYRVATNLGLNALRGRKRRARYENEAGRHALQNTASADPASTAEQKLEQEQVRQALMSIQPRSAQILVLRYTGFSYAEIATALSLAPGSVGTLLARAEQEFEKAFRKVK
jgi:RNA polymerase sigma-70 factor (ECF subfamily)